MALLRTWWLQEEIFGPAPTVKLDPSAPHLSWPQNKESRLSKLQYNTSRNLAYHRDETLCCVNQFSLAPNNATTDEVCGWTGERELLQTADLIRELRRQRTNRQSRITLFIARRISYEDVQALGYYLDMPQHFFDFRQSPLNLSPNVETANHVYFNIQFMEKYHNQVPKEARHFRNTTKVRFNFDDKHDDYVWRTTRISFAYATPQETAAAAVLVLTDLDDHLIFRGLLKLMKEEAAAPASRGGDVDIKGVAKILPHVFKIVTCQWGVFLNEADLHLDRIGSAVSSTDTTDEDQEASSLALHKLLRTWTEARCFITSAKKAADHMLHFHGISENDDKDLESLKSSLAGAIREFDRMLGILGENETTTQSLVNLLFQLASLKETKAANSLAKSIRRVALITFFYLPLQVAASIYGMNIYEITGEDGAHRIWEYVVLSLSLTGVTFLAWYAWSNVSSILKDRYLRQQELQKGRDRRFYSNSLGVISSADFY